MTAPLTVIIPTLNAAADLPATTDALLSGVGDGLIAELVISDGGSDDQISAVSDALGAALVTGPMGRGAQIARGIDKASTPWLLILHADTHLSEGWIRRSLKNLGLLARYKMGADPKTLMARYQANRTRQNN